MQSSAKRTAMSSQTPFVVLLNTETYSEHAGQQASHPAPRRPQPHQSSRKRSTAARAQFLKPSRGLQCIAECGPRATPRRSIHRPLFRVPLGGSQSAHSAAQPDVAKPLPASPDSTAGAGELVVGLTSQTDHVTALASCVTSLANALASHTASQPVTAAPAALADSASLVRRSKDAEPPSLPSAGSLAGLQAGKASSNQTMSASLLRRLHQLAPSSAAKLTATLQRSQLQLPTAARQRSVRLSSCFLQHHFSLHFQR